MSGLSADSTAARALHQGAWQAREQLFHDVAMRATGLSDFGDPSYREGLTRLLYSYDHEARFHTQGKLAMAYQLVGLLTSRLRTEDWFHLQPESASHRIARPLVITGMVRTGSTALHYLMGANPDMQHLQYWLALHPQPRPPRATWPAARDFQHAKIELDMMYAAGKSVLESIHFMTAEGPDEPGRLLGQGFSDDRFEVVNTVPTYSEWYANTVHRATYARHKRALQLVGSYEPEKRWLDKYPVHLRNLEAYLDTYPDACVIWTHRDPASVLPSYVSLCAHFRSLMEVTPDRPRIAREQLEVWARACDRGIELRRGREHQFHDVYFNDFMADPVGEVARIYQRFDQPFPAHAEAALRAWQAANPPGRFGTHDYERSDFGVPRAMVHERFAHYIARFPRSIEKRSAGE